MTNYLPPDLVPIILCGGSGTRLWPLSRELYPKPFLNLPGGSSLFQHTLTRLAGLAHSAQPVIVTNEEHRFYVLETLKKTGLSSRVILEPAPRNTAPAICLAALKLREEGAGDCLMLIAPSDHYFEDGQEFCRTVESAAKAANSGRIVTFGIIPASPETGYGYIRTGETFDACCKQVLRFVEKPPLEKAKEMLASGEYFWNSGIFLLSPNVFLAELEKYNPEILDQCRMAWRGKTEDGQFIRPEPGAFLKTPENSMDYAIMEKTDLALVAPLGVGWSDLGSWDAFYKAAKRDPMGNVTIGDVFISDAENSYIHSENRLIAAIGIKDMVIVESGDAVLIVPRNQTQDVKNVVNYLKANCREESSVHPLVYRPWGSYERLAREERFQVKRIVVKPGSSLSLQMHHHRSEHWIVVRGTAEVTIEDKVSLLTENQSAYIPIGSKHKLRNPGKIPLELIEVQSASYLGEDDIVREEDEYGRK